MNSSNQSECTGRHSPKDFWACTCTRHSKQTETVTIEDVPTTDTAHETGQAIKQAINRSNDKKKEVELAWPTDTAEQPHAKGCAFYKPTTDTSDWRERFDQYFLLPEAEVRMTDVRVPASVLKTFIEKELERAREELGVTAEQEKAHYDMAFEAGRAAERASLRTVIEGMKKETAYMPQIRDTALTDLLDTLQD